MHGATLCMSPTADSDDEQAVSQVDVGPDRAQRVQRFRV